MPATCPSILTMRSYLVEQTPGGGKSSWTYAAEAAVIKEYSFRTGCVYRGNVELPPKTFVKVAANTEFDITFIFNKPLLLPGPFMSPFVFQAFNATTLKAVGPAKFKENKVTQRFSIGDAIDTAGNIGNAIVSIGRALVLGLIGLIGGITLVSFAIAGGYGALVGGASNVGGAAAEVAKQVEETSGWVNAAAKPDSGFPWVLVIGAGALLYIATR